MSLGTGNEYAALVRDVEAPKKVWMAVAVSFASRLIGDDALNSEQLTNMMLTEWGVLHDNQIVPQRPRRQK